MIRVSISLQRIIVSALILTSIVGVLNLTPSQPAYAATYTIAPGGGDCNAANTATPIGVWDAKRLKCTLKFDINGSIEITGDGITLDGAKHTLTGDGTGNGVNVVLRTGVTVKNVIVKNFVTGINLEESNGNTLTGNTANSNVERGIELDASNGNTLTRNTANSNSVGIELVGADGNTLTSNTANSNSIYGILIQSAANNFLQKNTASLNITGGFGLSADTNTALKGNTANSNGLFGYISAGSTGLITSKNKCSGNGSGGSDPTGLCLPQP